MCRHVGNVFSFHADTAMSALGFSMHVESNWALKQHILYSPTRHISPAGLGGCYAGKTHATRSTHASSLAVLRGRAHLILAPH